MNLIAWGSKVSPQFRAKVVDICEGLMIHPDWLMACIAFESARTFAPDVRNKQSGAIGLIQFMPSTLASLGTTTEKTGKLSAVKQLDLVEQYFKPWTGKLRTLEDTYMAILWPGAIGKPKDYVLFDCTDPKYPKRYVQNAGLDLNRDGKITKAEAAARVSAMLELGRTKFIG